MEQKKNRKKRTGLLGIMVGCLVGGFLLGNGSGLNFLTGAKGKAVVYDDVIAIVNLDEGTTVDGETVNYGKELSEAISLEMKLVGLEEANRGLSKGNYSACLLIPGSFSKNLTSINEKPLCSVLSYALGEELSGEQREETLLNIMSIYQMFRGNLSKVYLSAVLQEYHEAQEMSEEIMERDQADLEELLGIATTDLVALIEIPESETLENTVEQLDLRDVYASNRETITALETSYEDFLSAAESGTESLVGLGEIKSTSAEIRSNEGTAMNNALRAVNGSFSALTELSGWDDTDLANEENAKMAEYKQNITGKEVLDSNGAVEEEAGVLVKYEEEREAYDTEVISRLKAYAAALGDYQTCFANLGFTETGGEETQTIGSITLTKKEYSYSYYTKSQVNSLKSVLAKELKKYDTGGTIGSSNSDYEDYIESLLEKEEIVPCEGSCMLVKSGELSSEIVVGGEDYSDGFQSVPLSQVNEQLASMIEEAETMREKRNQEITDRATGLGTLKEEIGVLAEAVTSYHAAQSHLSDTLLSYDFYSFFDETRIAGHVSALNQSMEEVEEAVSEHDGAYDSYVREITSVSGESIRQLEQSIQEGQSQAELALEQGLAGVKQSRSDSSEANRKALKEFAAKLPYTRAGGLENRAVYEFMATPVSLEEQAGGNSSTATTVTLEETDASRWLWCGLGLAGVPAACVVLWLLYRRKHLAGKGER